MIKRGYFFYLYLAVFITLALPIVKFIGPIRLAQFIMIITFIFIIYDDIKNKDIDFKLLSFLIIGALLITLISLNSSYTKIDEYKFLVKFIVVFPVSFYIGSRILKKFSITDAIHTIEFAMIFYLLSWLSVMYLPLPQSLLVHFVNLRDFGNGSLEFIPQQGTFYEAGALGFIVGATLLVSFLLRLEYKLFPKNKIWLFTLYGMTFYMIILSKNKTIWLAYLLILIFFIFYKYYKILSTSSYYTPREILLEDASLKKLLAIKSGYLSLAIIFLIGAFFTYNTLSDTPFITLETLQYKLQHERGAQFKEAWKLIEASGYFGGYGFGYVENYFKDLHILGVGKGDGSINNIILDMWLQGSLVALLYLFILFYISFSGRMYITIALPIFFFAFGLTNPVVSEETYLFLGISYGIIHHFLKQNLGEPA